MQEICFESSLYKTLEGLKTLEKTSALMQKITRIRKDTQFNAQNHSHTP
jgi:hypothetical protein